jgi:hypothetical protein
MSVNPTDEALIVALDFEGECGQRVKCRVQVVTASSGVHSIERSAQEDTLLVLFNTAISNLVSDPVHSARVLCLDEYALGALPQ